MALERRRVHVPMEEFAMSELGVTIMGSVMGAILHMISESAWDSFLEDKYPTKYPVYSTAISASIFTTIGIVMIIYGRKKEIYFLQYFGGGIILAEVAQWLDMVRVSFEIGTR